MQMIQEPCQGCSLNKREWPKQSKYLMGCGSLIFFSGYHVECVLAAKYYAISIHILMFQKPYEEGLLLTVPPFCIS